MPGLRYDQLLRGGRRGWAWPFLGLPLLTILLLVVQVGLVVVAAAVLFLSGTGAGEAQDRLTGDPVTPMFLTVVNLGWAAAIPAVWLVLWAAHGLRPGWAASVVGRIRWRWLVTCFGLSAAALLITLVVSALLPAQGTGADVAGASGELNDFTTQTRDFLIVIVLLTPLQAVGEEYAFRGYLTQACGALARSRVVAVVVPALVFALLHGLGQPIPVFVDRFAFGLVAGILVIVTGGLEAGIAMHVLNNLMAFGLALAFGDMTQTLAAADGNWWIMPVTLTQSLAFLALVTYAARRGGLQTRTSAGPVEGPPVLVGQQPSM